MTFLRTFSIDYLCIKDLKFLLKAQFLIFFTYKFKKSIAIPCEFTLIVRYSLCLCKCFFREPEDFNAVNLTSWSEIGGIYVEWKRWKEDGSRSRSQAERDTY